MTKLLTLAAAVLLAGCNPATSTAPAPDDALAAAPAFGATAGLVRRSIPAEDPGPPLYARATPIMGETFRADDWLVIPFYRDPACVPADFDLALLFDFPGAGGPGAFACPLRVAGALLIEPDAPLGTFPRHVLLHGSNVPIWLVPWAAYQSSSADGTFTMAELLALEPLRGIASRFTELLQPRTDDHKIVIDASGTLEDGRTFHFGVTHIMDDTRSIRLQLR